MKYTIEKEWTDFPAAHRQPKHSGHCSLIHGHNWGVKVVLKSDKLDENGFIHDFGDFKKFKTFLDSMLDHTLLLQSDDPFLPFLKDSSIMAVRVVDSTSCEGLAKFIYEVAEAQDWGQYLHSVTVTEDSKNSATYGN